jgi:hypothetical protein
VSIVAFDDGSARGEEEIEMFAYLKSLASRLTRQGTREFLPPAEDPPIGTREPRKRGPGGRSSAVAIAEPDDPASVRAFGSVRSGPRGR